MKKHIPFLVILALSAALLAAVPAFAAAVEEGAASAPPIDLTPLFQAVIALLASIVTVKVIPWIKHRTTAEQQAKINTLTRTLVYAAEQIFRDNEKSGEQKMAYVKSKLLERGFDVDMDAIEASVMALKLEGNAQKDAEKTAT